MRFLLGLIVPLPLILSMAARAADRCGDVDLSKLTSRIYVAPTGTDSDSCGASSLIPCQSIQRGIDRCGRQGCGVLVRYGLYSLTEPIRLKELVNVYGRCVFGDDLDRKYRSVIQAPPDGKPGIVADHILRHTLLDGVFVKGSDATSPGGASIVMTVSNSPIVSGPLGLTIAHTILSSGRGANGAPGGTGGIGGRGGGGSGAEGGTGGAGGAACGGGPSGTGGKGADLNQIKLLGCVAYCNCLDANDSGGETGSPSGAAKGGPGRGRGHSGCACDNGHVFEDAEDGASGGQGQPGACASTGGVPNANIWGSFDGANWVSIRGGQGSVGAVGAGGGGGGSGGYAVEIHNLEPHPVSGRPGGGGGGGGCGGEGGIGGQQGGASIPLVLFESSVQTDDLVLVSGPGGRGGPGGTGGTGGAGGDGAPGLVGRKVTMHGAACTNQAPGNGGTGGPGGQGGAGGGGGGGDGGPSVGIALVGNANSNGVGIYASQPGTGGAFGEGARNASNECKGGDGGPGVPGGGKGDWKHGW